MDGELLGGRRQVSPQSAVFIKPGRDVASGYDVTSGASF